MYFYSLEPFCYGNSEKGQIIAAELQLGWEKSFEFLAGK